MNLESIKNISIRKLLQSDIELICNYWFGQSPSYWTDLGVDITRLGTRENYCTKMNTDFDKSNGIQEIAIILLNGEPIGHHSLTHHIENESAIFHTHIWNSTHRKQGIATISYPKACLYFFQTLRLKKIIFKTPKINIGANRLKEKLGIKKISETIYDGPLLLKPLEANLYEITVDAPLLSIVSLTNR